MTPPNTGFRSSVPGWRDFRPTRSRLLLPATVLGAMLALANPAAAEVDPTRAAAGAGAAPLVEADGTAVALATATAPAVLRPLSERGRELAPQVLDAMPGCAVFDPPSDAEFHRRILAMCTAVAGRIAAGTAANVVDVYAAIQLKDYSDAMARLAAGASSATAAAPTPPARRVSDTAAYLIARQLKLFEIYRAMIGKAG
jgi:hypothetical protein